LAPQLADLSISLDAASRHPLVYASLDSHRVAEMNLTTGHLASVRVTSPVLGRRLQHRRLVKPSRTGPFVRGQITHSGTAPATRRRPVTACIAADICYQASDVAGYRV
jgi:hypothetical protein